MLSVNLDEGTRDGETNCSGLAVEATALDVHLDVVLLGYAHLIEGLLNDELED